MTSKNQQTEEKGSRYFQQHCLFYIDLQSEFYYYTLLVFFCLFDMDISCNKCDKKAACFFSYLCLQSYYKAWSKNK